MVDFEMLIRAVLSMGILGGLFASGLAYASVKFGVEGNPKQDLIEGILPGINCGACGKPGCASYAEAVVNGESGIDCCPVGGSELTEGIAEIMGVAPSCSSERKAQLICQGGKDETFNHSDYRGLSKCGVADSSQNFKSCEYGCLGFGDCALVCDFDAIIMSENGLPQIDMDKCTACTKCVKECPRDIIIMSDIDEDVITKCKSLLKGKKVKTACSKGCITCTLCAKKCPVDAIEMVDNLPEIDHKACVGCGICVKVCPTDSMVETPF